MQVWTKRTIYTERTWKSVQYGVKDNVMLLEVVPEGSTPMKNNQ